MAVLVAEITKSGLPTMFAGCLSTIRPPPVRASASATSAADPLLRFCRLMSELSREDATRPENRGYFRGFNGALPVISRGGWFLLLRCPRKLRISVLEVQNVVQKTFKQLGYARHVIFFSEEVA